MKTRANAPGTRPFALEKSGVNSAAHLGSLRQPWCIRDRKLLIPVRCTMRKFCFQRPLAGRKSLAYPVHSPSVNGKYGLRFSEARHERDRRSEVNLVPARADSDRSSNGREKAPDGLIGTLCTLSCAAI
jgi:hypothetical protein